jgi:dTDP-4-amino-4,6-dideoxygalactose transaminase
MLVVNDNRFLERAEIIREKGTNRSQFFRGEIDKYEWVDIGSSYLPTDIVAAFLYAQLENMDAIQTRRKAIWHRYMQTLLPLQVQGKIKLPYIPEYATNNGHIFYVLCADMDTRTGLIDYMKQNSVYAAFHYVSLHKSQFFMANNTVPNLPECDKYSDCLLRLPLFYDLTDEEIERVCDLVMGYYQGE